MDVLIELLLDNIIFLFVIIAGIVSFFNRLMSTGNEGERRVEGKETQRQGEASGRQTVREVMRRMQEMAESLDPETAEGQGRRVERKASDEQVMQPTSSESASASTTYSFEQQRDEQFKRLQKQYESTLQSEDVDRAIDPDSPIYNQTHAATSQVRIQQPQKRSKSSVDLKSRLDANGLIESVIMAEVLGPPRARKRYSNRYLER